MAAKKKPKTKATKKKKQASTHKVAVSKKAVSKKKTAAKAAPKTKRVAAGKPAPMPKPAAPPGTERIGVVTHYFSHLSVAIVRLETGTMRVGDVIHIKGHTSDFTQPVESMEVDHVHVSEARSGQSFGLRVREHAREHDVVYKAKP